MQDDDEDDEREDAEMQREAARLVPRMRETGDYTYDTAHLRVFQMMAALRACEEYPENAHARARLGVMTDRVSAEDLVEAVAPPGIRQVKEDRLKVLALRNILGVLADSPEFLWSPEPERGHLKALVAAHQRRAAEEEAVRRRVKPLDLRTVAAIPGFAGDDEA